MTPKQRLLATLMSDMSEQAWCAGWMEGTEYDLWDMVTTPRRQWGLHIFSDDEIAALKELSEWVGGWIIFHLDYGEVFVPMDIWKERYAVHTRRRSHDPP